MPQTSECKGLRPIYIKQSTETENWHYYYYYYNMKIVHIGTTTKKGKNLTREKNLTTIYGGLSNMSNNEAKSVLSIKKINPHS